MAAPTPHGIDRNPEGWTTQTAHARRSRPEQIRKTPTSEGTKPQPVAMAKPWRTGRQRRALAVPFVQAQKDQEEEEEKEEVAVAADADVDACVILR